MLNVVWRAALTLLFLVMAAGVQAKSAGVGEAKLNKFLDGLQTMEATFIQTLIDPSGQLIEESHGTLWLSRPGRFRLQYTNPYEQLYVADGKKIWMYDKDLEQVTVKPQSDTLGSTPAMLLSTTEPMQKNFAITELGEHEGFQWLELKPLAADSNFDYVRLAMDGDVLRAMEMVDGFGQTTRLYFDPLKRNPKLSADKFKFEPPPGVDVIGEQ